MFQKRAISAAAALAIVAIVGAEPAWAQQQQLERVEITGSSLRRVEAETALPITVIKVEDLVRQGVTSAEGAMARIAANQSSFATSSSIGATTGGKAEADLRGLNGPTGGSASKTLVLLNGRRLSNHPFDAAAVDLNSIPLAAVDRIEVLRDGASSLYGTDAIGGVINFILKRDFRGLEVSLEKQSPREPGGDVTRFNLTGGFGSLTENRFNVLASVDVRKQKVLEAAQRKFAATGVLLGDVVGGTSGSSFPGDVNGFEPSLPNCDPPASIPNPARTGCRYDFTRDIDLIPENKQVTGVVKGTLAFAPEHTASLELMSSKNTTTSRVAPSPVSHLIPASSPFYPAGAPLTPGGIPDLTSNNPNATVPGGVVNWRMVPAGKRTSGNETTADRAVLEFNGTVAGKWDYRAAAGTARSKTTESVKLGYVNDDIMQDGIFQGIINPFGTQTAAGAAFIDSAQVRDVVAIGKNQVDFVDARLTTDLAQMAAGPLSFAIGAEYRREKSNFENLPITGSLGSLGLDPDADTAGSRNVSAVYAELGIPVVKNLDVTLAARYDRYSDVGNTFNPKLGIRYQPMRQLLVRGSVNTGFRAPTLYEIYQPGSLTFTSDNYDDPLLCPGGNAVPGASPGVVCGQQVLRRIGGPVGNGRPANSLEPEKSKTFSAGLVFDPTPQMTFSVDVWNVAIRNLVSGLPEQAVFGDATKYAGRFVRCSQLPATAGPGIDRTDIDACLNTGFDPIAYIDVPTENLGDLKTRGVDLSAAWRSTPSAAGVIGFSIDGVYIHSYKYQREKGGAFISATGRYSDNAPVFRWQHTLNASWSKGPWSVILGQRFRGGYTDQDGVNKVGDYSLWDLSAAWSGIKGLTIQAGVANLFDKDPPLSVQSTTFQRGYDPRFTDPLGRTLRVRIGYKF